MSARPAHGLGGDAHSVPLRLAPHHVGGGIGRTRVQLSAQVRRERLRRVLCSTRRGCEYIPNTYGSGSAVMRCHPVPARPTGNVDGFIWCPVLDMVVVTPIQHDVELCVSLSARPGAPSTEGNAMDGWCAIVLAV